jgi:hypothetical protein
VREREREKGGGGRLLAVVREGEVGGYKERNEEKKIKK